MSGLRPGVSDISSAGARAGEALQVPSDPRSEVGSPPHLTSTPRGRVETGLPLTRPPGIDNRYGPPSTIDEQTLVRGYRNAPWITEAEARVLDGNR